MERVVARINACAHEHNATCQRACDVTQDVTRASYRVVATRHVRNRTRIRVTDGTIGFDAEGWFDEEHGLIRCRTQNVDGEWFDA
jgi:hypothetical protein